MAYVRVTDRLRDSVQRKIIQMQHVAEEPYDNPEIPAGTALHGLLVEAFTASRWAAAPQLRGKVPQDWLERVSTISIEFALAGGRKYAVRIFTNSDVHVPKGRPYGSYYSQYIESVSEADCTGELAAWLAAQGRRLSDLEDVRDTYKGIASQIDSVLRSYTSLSAAIKAVPELEMYVPEEYLAKMRERVVRAPKKEVQVDVDRDALATAAVAHRMSTAARGN